MKNAPLIASLALLALAGCSFLPSSKTGSGSLAGSGTTAGASSSLSASSVASQNLPNVPSVPPAVGTPLGSPAASYGSSASSAYGYSSASSVGASSSASVPVTGGGTSSAGYLAVVLQANPAEAQPGDRIQFTIPIRNFSTQTVQGFEVKATLGEYLDLLTPGLGVANGDQITWKINFLNPGEMYTLAFAAKVQAKAESGDASHTTVTVSGGNLQGATTAATDVRIVSRLPQTGVNLRGAAGTLTPIAASPAGTVAWIALGAAGLIAGGVFARAIARS